MPTSRNWLRILPWMGWGSVVSAMLIASTIVWSNQTQREILADQAHERSFRRMLATKDRVEAHLHNIWLCAQLISLDPHIATLAPGPYDQLQTVYKATSEKHRLTEIYVTERDFDGTRRPFLTLIQKSKGELVESHRSLAREAEEYRIIREHIRRFIDDPSVDFLVSNAVRLCVGRPGVACSVPVQSGGKLIGIVSGMVPSRDISRILELNSAGNEVVLAKENGSIFCCRHVSPENQSWFQERLSRQGVKEFFAERDHTFRVGGHKALWTQLNIPGHEKWYLAYLCDESSHSQLSGFQGVLIGWGSAGVVLVLGAAVMILCQVTPALVTARARADKHARQLTESEARYRSLVDNINLGVTLVDADHNIVMTNKAQARMFNKPTCEFIGTKCFAEFEKRDAVCPYCPGTRAMQSGKPAEIETESVRDDGSRFVAHVRAFPISASNGQPTGFIEVVEDITERKQAEEQSRARQAE
ncbi:MAG: PAS domain-containing protein, partial [Phycisphaerae bacterium]